VPPTADVVLGDAVVPKEIAVSAIQAWSNFEELLMRYLPPALDFYSKAAKYRRFIHTCQEKYSWQSVYTYDTKFRTGLAQSNSFNYDECDIRLFALTFDALALRKDVSRCFRCQSLEHRALECPFVEGAEVEKKAKTTTSAEICNNFNSGRCTFPRCKRRHACKHCNGPKPALTCGCKAGSTP
jgi:hypothetical protein